MYGVRLPEQGSSTPSRREGVNQSADDLFASNIGRNENQLAARERMGKDMKGGGNLEGKEY